MTTPDLSCERFREWLANKPGEEIVASALPRGHGSRCNVCPIARWLSHEYGGRWHVDGRICSAYNAPDYEHALPSWAVDFVDNADRASARPDASWMAMTASQALRLLDAIPVQP